MSDPYSYEETVRRVQEMAAGVANGAGDAPRQASPAEDPGYQATLEEYREEGADYGGQIGGALGGTFGAMVTAPAGGIGAIPGGIVGKELGERAGAELGVDVGRIIESDDPGEIGAGFGGIAGAVTGMGHDEAADYGRDLGNDPYVVAEFEAAEEAVVETVAAWANDPETFYEDTAVSAVDSATDYVADTAEAVYDEVTSFFD